MLRIATLTALCLAFTTLSPEPSLAEDRLPGYQYVEESAKSTGELKRVTVTDSDGNLRGRIVYFTDGRVHREVYRKDGTLEFSREVWGNGNVKEQINYDNTGKTVSSRKAWRSDGSLEWEATRKSDGNTLSQYYYPDGKVRRIRELLNQGGFVDTTYRKDGSKWYGSRREPGEAGRGTDLYFAPDGRYLKRTYSGTLMQVEVFDKTGKLLYRQHWVSGTASWMLLRVEEPLSGAGHRLIGVQGGKIKDVQYFKADGTLERTEQAGALSVPVDSNLLRELADDDPTRPIIRQLR